jgi:hypothetical protein
METASEMMMFEVGLNHRAAARSGEKPNCLSVVVEAGL